MEALILTPPIAFLIYVLLAAFLMIAAAAFAGQPNPNAAKSSPFASGEDLEPNTAAPGYGPFFKVALFFAVLHLGVIVLGSAAGGTGAMLYLIGLMLALIALILG